MLLHLLPALTLALAIQVAPADPKALPLPSPAEVRNEFRALLNRPKVPLDVQSQPSIKDPDALIWERLSFAAERTAEGRIERVPVLVVRPDRTEGRRPVVIVLHGTGGSKERMEPWLKDLARLGFIAVAIDARYHGDRAGGARGSEAYNEAITRAWRATDSSTQEHPFYYDTCWDLWRTLDYLETRPDVDAKRIGMIGISMGGIETWLAAAVDERVAVAVPAIAVQSFRWSLENGQWQGRARTIAAAHQAAARDLGETEVNERVCRALWAKVIPGILDRFDGPSMVRLFAGRPLLILNGERDPNCPLPGAELAFSAARTSFEQAGARDRLSIMVAPGAGHTVTPPQRQAALDWFVRWLRP
jgi:dienelactone hydrolase